MSPRGKSMAVRIFLGLLLAAVLLYGGAHAAIRSPWFRVAVERRLSQMTGMEVRVGSIRTTESLNLRLGDISALEDRAGLEIHVMRVKWALFPLRIRRLIVEDAVLTMAPDEEQHLLPKVVGDQAWTFLGHLTQGLVPVIAPVPEELRTEPQKVAAPSPFGGKIDRIRQIRLVRSMFSIRDASGRERAAAKDLEIERNLEGTGPDEVERWDIQAAVLTVEGMQQTGVEWSALHTAQGWKVTHFATQEVSGWEPAASPEELQEATETYRTLLDSI